MIITAFISGLISLLTPIVFPIIFQNFILFDKFGNTKIEHKKNILIFIGLTIGLISFLLPEMFLDKKLMNELSSSNNITYFIIFPLLVIIIWISFSFIKKLKFLTQGIYLSWIKFLAIIYFSFRLFIGSLSGIGPIMGTLLMEDKNIYTASFGYALGISIPTLIIMILLSNRYEYLTEKKWWKVIQIITIVYLLIALIQKILLIN